METYIKIKAWRDCYDIRDINIMTTLGDKLRNEKNADFNSLLTGAD
jgi:hypothetical protein